MIGGVEVQVIIDSGVNVLDRRLWEYLKQNKVKCESKLSNKLLYEYGNTKPHTIAGAFMTEAAVKQRCIEAEFIVIEEKAQVILGRARDIQFQQWMI